MQNKYKLTQNTKGMGSLTLYQIQALNSFGSVQAGDLGGWIEKESNLSQEGICWVFRDARVFENAGVYGSALVYGSAEVYGNARIFGNTEVFENAEVYGDANVYGDAKVYGDARVFGNAEVSGNARIKDLDITSTNQYKNIVGFKYSITVTYAHIQIGCKIIFLNELDNDFSDLEESKYFNIPRIRALTELCLDQILEEMEE